MPDLPGDLGKPIDERLAGHQDRVDRATADLVDQEVPEAAIQWVTFAVVRKVDRDDEGRQFLRTDYRMIAPDGPRLPLWHLLAEVMAEQMAHALVEAEPSTSGVEFVDEDDPLLGLGRPEDN